MAKEHMLFDKTEIILGVTMGNKVERVSLQASNITSITISTCEERKFLISKPSEKIIIMSNKMAQPIEFYKSKEEKYWESYKTQLEQFAKNNRISFHKNVD